VQGGTIRKEKRESARKGSKGKVVGVGRRAKGREGKLTWRLSLRENLEPGGRRRKEGSHGELRKGARTPSTKKIPRPYEFVHLPKTAYVR